MPFDASEFSGDYRPDRRFWRAILLMKGLVDILRATDRIILSLLRGCGRAYLDGVVAYCVAVHGCPPSVLTSDGQAIADAPRVADADGEGA
jgi:hypothetical protein